MGCINSKVEVNNMHSNIFEVMYIDGNITSPGRLEVTEVDISLYQQDKPPLTWPLMCLRRYGITKPGEIFTFESGRRCYTGAGIFSFKCKRTEDLFNLIKLKVNQVSQVRIISRSLARATELPYTLHPAAARARLALTEPYDMEEPYMNPIPFRSDVIRMGSVIPKRSPPSMPPPPPPISQSYPSSLYTNKEVLSSISMEMKHDSNKSLGRLDNTISNNGCMETELMSTQCGMEVISHDATSSSSLTMAPYMNIENCSKSSSRLSTQSSSETVQIGKSESNDTSASDPVYMNINPGQKHVQNIATSIIHYHRRPPPPPPPSTPSLHPDEEEGSYVNLKTSEIESLRRRFPSASVTSEISLLDSFASTGCPIGRVNYAILDLDKKDVPASTSDNTTTNPTLSPPESSSKPRKGYVTIDFKKTDALEIISQSRPSSV
ncbi:hypothetical protein DMN91_000230 [Ooceraea biroi]|uniref:IRS-type PTB domain-containing protein n=1 Tax=Ooceraea biroi TaxID=2015173 RepID=A0A3L8E1D5_OOCBI|nr:fibroblast growth factor receptor substrate 2 isoform X3 [Ooceraea biroi]RLU26436.1 hypothetical protein DMN91_000230 [Ooceraea biroi]